MLKKILKSVQKLSTLKIHQVTVEQMSIIHHIHGFLGQVPDIWTYLNN